MMQPMMQPMMDQPLEVSQLTENQQAATYRAKLILRFLSYEM